MRVVLFSIVIICAGYGCMPSNNQLPVDRHATKETKNMYKNLKKIASNKQILFGQEDCTAYGIGWKSEKNRSDMKLVSGYHPSVYGWDVGGIEKGDASNLDQVEFDEMRSLIQEAYHRGGINTISWHVDNPVNDASSWEKSSIGSVDSILPGAIYNQKFNVYLDNLAAFLETLKTDDGEYIPIVFRPWHEHTGNWFWWGSGRCSPSSYIQLWQYTVNYLVNKKQLHHLLFAYSPDRTSSIETYFERYPGDQYIDILGLDYYHRGGEATANEFVKDARNRLIYIAQEAQRRNKIAAFTETGLETITQADWWINVLFKTIEDTGIAYVMVWRNAFERENHYFGPTPGHPANEDFIQFISSDKIITEKNIKQFYK